MVCAVGVSASERVGSWTSMESSLARRVTRSRSRGVDNPAGKLAMALRMALDPLGDRLRFRRVRAVMLAPVNETRLVKRFWA